jgi:serine/threonine protein kinase
MVNSDEPFFDALSLSPGTTVGDSYKIKSVVSRSLESVVYLARHTLMEQDVVLKVLNFRDGDHDEKRLIRFQQEAKMAGGLRHPNIVKVLSAGSIDGRIPYIVMELVAGETLKERLLATGSLRLGEFQSIFCQLLSGLECAHREKLLHRDIKPENILLTKDQEGALLAKLADFGIARSMDEGNDRQALTESKDVLGSPAYMSPEQCQKRRLDERSDLYAMACVMYEALSGRPPFLSESPFELMYRQVNDRPPSLSTLRRGIPAKLGKLIEKCLSKDPACRPATAGNLNSVLAGLKMRDEDARDSGVRGVLAAALFQLFRRPVLAASIFACLLLAGAGTFSLIQTNLQNKTLSAKLSEDQQEEEFFQVLRQGMKLREARHFADAENCLKQALELAFAPDRRLLVKPKQLAEALHNLSLDLEQQNKLCPDEFSGLLELARPPDGSYDGNYTYALGYLAHSKRKHGQFQEALKLDLESLKQVRQVTADGEEGNNPLNELHMARNAALDHVYCENFPQARTILEEVCHLLKRTPAILTISEQKTKFLFVHCQLAARSNDPNDCQKWLVFLKEIAGFHPEQEKNVKDSPEAADFDYAVHECEYARKLLDQINSGASPQATLAKAYQDGEEKSRNDF